jgi:hypothetical protein
VSFATDSILPDPPEGATAILHDREYRARAFRIAPDRIVIQGAVRDQKPPGLYVPADPDPMTIHHMQLSLEITFPGLEIVAVDTHFEGYPQPRCPSITAAYDGLVGISIARGFTHKVRELFGGPRGCTHVTALLQAMAPVAMQCFWSMHAADAAESGDVAPIRPRADTSDRIVDTCHVWAADGELVGDIRAGQTPPVPIFITERLDRLGIPLEDDRVEP